MIPLKFNSFLLCFSILVAAGSNKKPNIILFMADDMGIGDTSAYLGIKLVPGAKTISKTLRTPNLEKFAQKGMIFTDAHAPASMCSSTRYSLLTGRLSHRSYLKGQGWLPHGPNRPMIQRALTTLPEMLQRNGYHTSAIGKYHVGMDFDDGQGKPANEFDHKDVDFEKPILDGPTHHGFDEFFGVPGNTEDSLDTEPRIYIRNDRWTFTDRSRMEWTGMKDRVGQILSAPDWNLAKLGPDYLHEGVEFLERQKDSTTPFFLYYAPNSNHFQRNQSGDYAVPQSIQGIEIKGKSLYSDGTKGGERDDMVLENDVAFGILLKTLSEIEDSRNPGEKLIDNTLVIFTSDNGPNVGDNNGINDESGGLRGKKAKLWEGGHRVPFMVYWKGHFEEKGVNRNLFCLTDLFSTFARIVGDNLFPTEAQDSLDSLDYWKDPKKTDSRPRYFFCHLGPPYENDAIAIRQKSKKVIVQGGLAQPWTKEGSRGSIQSLVTYDLDRDPYEQIDFSENKEDVRTNEMVAELLKIHNQGFSRNLNLPLSQSLILEDGWHNLRNDLTGSIGYEFELLQDQVVTHLGMWVDHDRELPVRSARGIPNEKESDQPSRTGKQPRTIKGPHVISLYKITDQNCTPIVNVTMNPGTTGDLVGEFRYLRLEKPISIKKNSKFLLTMSTTAGDGDYFHDPVSFDGLSPLINSTVKIIRSCLFKSGQMNESLAIPAFEDLHPNYHKFRIPVGPTLRFQPLH
ncbi:MAG: hypothetical protein CMI27_00535 [Opitutae bacterium]|nr:hypothetical protein [Opitutae bacterium]|tara:strand:- start:11738 stop:13948 length:2211 start_codon:yes stop_codon:yes gene_type:complete